MVFVKRDGDQVVVVATSREEADRAVVGGTTSSS